MTRVFQVDPQHIDPEIMEQAAHSLQHGQLVAFPTETVYGIGANALDPAAVDRIYAAKKRPKGDPLIVHIADAAQLPMVVAEVPQIARRLIEQFWPGPLTLILPKNASIPNNVTSGMPAVAVRMPNHPIALDLIRRAGVPVAAPSANLFSRPSSTSGRHVLEDFIDSLDIVLDGGDASIGVESTVINLVAEPPIILRPGGLSLEALQAVIPEVQLKSTYAAEDEVVASPGMLLKHYSPNARLLLFTGTDASRVCEQMQLEAQQLETSGLRIGVLGTSAQREPLAADNRVFFELGAADDLEGISKSLYRGMRELDAQQVDVILVSAPLKEGLGLAIWDRLYRAAEGNIIRVD